MDYNNLGLIGRLTANPDYAMSQTGHPRVTFTLAVNGMKENDVSFIDCKAFEGTANLINQYCQKGQQVCVQGSLRQDRWEDQTGAKHSKLTVIVNNIQFLSRAKGDQQPAPQTDHYAPEANPYFNPESTGNAQPVAPQAVPASSFQMPPQQF